MRRFSFIVPISALLWLFSAALQATDLPLHFFEERVLSNLQGPTYLVTLPSSEMILLEKHGAITLFDPADSPPVLRDALNIPDVDSTGERGLTSAALDPDFLANGFIYVYYQHVHDEETSYSRILRLTFEGTELSMDSAVVVWENNEAAHDCCHYGGGLDFGPDGMLYLTTGEEFQPEQSQDLTRAGGKIIRLDVRNITDSTPWLRDAQNDHIIPADNPPSIVDGPGGNLDEIWAYGLRNPYRASWDIPTGHFFIGDVGGNVRRTAIESLELGQAGANFGWPLCEGPCDNIDVTNPIYSYAHTNIPVWRGAIIGGPVYRAELFPEEYQGALFVADFARENITVLRFDSDGNIESYEDFIGEGVDSPVALEIGPEGALYVVSFLDNSVTRYIYTTDRIKPTITTFSASTTEGPPPLDVQFHAEATVNGEAELDYAWVFGDGNSEAGESPMHRYEARGTYEAYASVTNGELTATSEPITIKVGNAPEASILTPNASMMFEAGDTLQLSGHGVDVDEVLVDEQFRWAIEFLHDEHAHPVVEMTGREAQYTIPVSGHDYFGNTGYRINLTITDSDGLTTTESVDIAPNKVNLNLDAFPSGITILVDGLPYQTPVTYDTLIKFDHTITALASVCHNGTQYEFENWSDGGAITHSLTAPSQGLTLSAFYTPVDNCSSESISLPGQEPIDIANQINEPAPLAFVQQIMTNESTPVSHTTDTLIVTENQVISASRSDYALTVFGQDTNTGNLTTEHQLHFDATERLTTDIFAPTGAIQAIDNNEFVAIGQMFRANNCAPGDLSCGVSTIATFEVSSAGISMIDSIERSPWIKSLSDATITVSHDAGKFYETMVQDGLPGITTYRFENNLSINRIRNSVNVGITSSTGKLDTLEFNGDSSSAVLNRVTPMGSILSVLKHDTETGELLPLTDYSVFAVTGFRLVNDIALSSNGQTLFALLSSSTQSLSGALATFNIDENGQLTLIDLNTDADEQFAGSFSQPISIAINQSENLLYVANRHPSDPSKQALHMFSVDGAETPDYIGAYTAENETSNSTLNLDDISNIALSTNDAFLYATANDSITVFAAHSDTIVEATSPQSALIDSANSTGFRVYNAGPATATGIRLSISSTTEIVDVSEPEACRIAGITVVCSLAQLPVGAAFDLSITTLNSEQTDLQISATVSQQQTDLNLDSNSVELVTRTVEKVEDLTPPPEEPALVKPTKPILVAANPSDSVDEVENVDQADASGGGCSVLGSSKDQLLYLLVLLAVGTLFKRRHKKQYT